MRLWISWAELRYSDVSLREKRSFHLQWQVKVFVLGKCSLKAPDSEQGAESNSMYYWSRFRPSPACRPAYNSLHTTAFLYTLYLHWGRPLFGNVQLCVYRSVFCQVTTPGNRRWPVNWRALLTVVFSRPVTFSCFRSSHEPTSPHAYASDGLDHVLPASLVTHLALRRRCILNPRI